MQWEDDGERRMHDVAAVKRKLYAIEGIFTSGLTTERTGVYNPVSFGHTG